MTAAQTVGGETSRHSTVPVVIIGVPSQLSAPDVRTFPVAGVEAMLVQRLFPCRGSNLPQTGVLRLDAP